MNLLFGVDLFHLQRQIISEFVIGVGGAVLMFKQEGKEFLHALDCKCLVPTVSEDGHHFLVISN